MAHGESRLQGVCVRGSRPGPVPTLGHTRTAGLYRKGPWPLASDAQLSSPRGGLTEKPVTLYLAMRHPAPMPRGDR